MSKLRVAFIGTGRKPEKAGPMGYAMAYQHGEAYLKLPDAVEMVAAADIKLENAEAFGEKYGFNDFYLDYKEMLAQVKPDLVSICTWPHLHAQMIIDCAEAGVPAIHSEKPVAYAFGDAKRCVAACEKSGTKLTFNHQRRYGRPFYLAKQMLDEGVIGQIQKIEIGVGDLFDYGSHNFDMANYFNCECNTKWVLCGLDYSKEKLIFGTHNENSAYALWEYENGVFGSAATGECGASVGCHHRVIGNDGMIEIGRAGVGTLRVLRAGQDWEEVDVQGESCHGPGFIDRCIADVVDAIQTGRESMMNARNALRATEQIFACWESVRRRGMVPLPLDIEDNPLVDMVEKGDLKPAKG
ncbi:MAG: Gfo/Idh/MocA family oxidoreductase [Armatimonadia bacterium]